MKLRRTANKQEEGTKPKREHEKKTMTRTGTQRNLGNWTTSKKTTKRQEEVMRTWQ